MPVMKAIGHMCHSLWSAFGKHVVFGKPDEVVLHDYPALVLTTPFIIIGYLVYLLEWSGLDGLGHVTGWLWLVALVVTMLALSVDLSRTSAFVALIVAGSVVLLGYWLSTEFKFTVLGSIGRWFVHLAPMHPGDTALGVSFVLSIAWAIMWVHVRLNRRWIISNNGIFHREFLKQTTDYRWAANAVKIDFPSALAQLLLGAGTIRLPGSQLLPAAEIQHIPLLAFKQNKIMGILESISVTPVGAVGTAAAPVGVVAQPLA